MENSPHRLHIGPISPAAPGPLYQQVIEGIKREVSEGRLAPETQLPSFRALAEELLVSLITIKRAYEELEKEGIVYRKQGIGTFVANLGDEKSREAKSKEAETLLTKAAQAALQSGMDRKTFIDMAEQTFRDEKGNNR